MTSTTDTWAAGPACPTCGGPTLAPRAGHPEEIGDYCEACGTSHDRPQRFTVKSTSGATAGLYMHRQGRTRTERGRTVLATAWTAEVDQAKVWTTLEGAQRFATTWAVYGLVAVGA